MTHAAHTLTTRDGVRIAFAQHYQDSRSTAVIVCPGFFQSSQTPTFQRLSRALAEQHNVIAMDFRGHGRSGGRYTFSAKEGADLEAVLEWARARYTRLGVIGFSMGGAIAINTLSRSAERVRSLIAISAPSTFEQIEFRFWMPEAIRTGLQGMERGAGCRPGNLLLPKERPIEVVSRLAPLPVLFIHGTRDVIVGVDHSRRLHAAAAEPKRLAIIEGGSHAQAMFRDDPRPFTNLLLDWLAQNL